MEETTIGTGMQSMWQLVPVRAKTPPPSTIQSNLRPDPCKPTTMGRTEPRHWQQAGEPGGTISSTCDVDTDTTTLPWSRTRLGHDGRGKTCFTMVYYTRLALTRDTYGTPHTVGKIPNTWRRAWRNTTSIISHYTAWTTTGYGRGLHAHEGHCKTTTSPTTAHTDTTGMHGSSDSEHTTKGGTGPKVAHKVPIRFALIRRHPQTRWLAFGSGCIASSVWRDYVCGFHRHCVVNYAWRHYVQGGTAQMAPSIPGGSHFCGGLRTTVWVVVCGTLARRWGLCWSEAPSQWRRCCSRYLGSYHSSTTRFAAGGHGESITIVLIDALRDAIASRCHSDHRTSYLSKTKTKRTTS